MSYVPSERSSEKLVATLRPSSMSVSSAIDSGDVAFKKQ